MATLPALLSGSGQSFSQTPDGQLQLGLQIIQQSYNRRADELLREVEHWKRMAQHHKQEEEHSRHELAIANQRAEDMRRQLNDKQLEVNTLTEDRNAALQQLETVKKNSSQLLNFKNTISSMLQMDNGLDIGTNIQGMLNTLPVDSVFSNSQQISGLELPRTASRTAPQQSGVPRAPVLSGMRPLATTQSAPASAPWQGDVSTQDQGYFYTGTSSAPKSSFSTATAMPEQPLDAATYYQQVKRVLAPEQFREFSANIKKLNTGQQSVEETLHKVREIFGEHRPFLFVQLQQLIRQAEEDARKRLAQAGRM